MAWRAHGSSNLNPSSLCPEANQQTHKGGPNLSLLGGPASLAQDSRLACSVGLRAPELVFCSVFVVFSSVPGSAWFLLETHSMPLTESLSISPIKLKLLRAPQELQPLLRNDIPSELLEVPERSELSEKGGEDTNRSLR